MATGNVTKQKFVTEKITAPTTLDLEAESSGNIEVSVAKSGYKPIGFCGVQKSGTNSNKCYFYEFWVDDGSLGFKTNYARAYFYNTASSAASLTVDFIISYVSV